MNRLPILTPQTCSESAGNQPLGLARLARRLRRRALDLVAMGVLTGFCLAFGETLTAWWSASAPSSGEVDTVAATRHAALDADDAITFEFGSMPVRVTRHDVDGNLEAVWDHLHALGREQLLAYPQGDARSGHEGENVALTSREQRILEHLAELAPSSTIAGCGELFRLDGAVPTVVAVSLPRESSTQSEPVAAANHSTASVGRLAGWGMAVPSVEDGWTLYLFDPAGSSNARDSLSMEATSWLPEGGQRILAVTEPNGARLEAFVGPSGPGEEGRTGEWAGRFRRHLHDQGWTAVSQVREPQSWTAHFTRALAGSVETCQVHIHTTAEGRVRGISSWSGTVSAKSSRGAE